MQLDDPRSPEGPAERGHADDASGGSVPGRVGRLGVAAEVLALFVVIALQVPFVLSGDRGPLDADYGRIFLGPLFQVRDALHDGHLLFWDSIRFGGTPYWALPNTAPAYPPLVAALYLFEPVRATNLVLIAHLLLGAWGVRAVATRLGASRVGAFVAASVFLFAPYTLIYATNQPWATMALGFQPWAYLQVARRTRGADWRACGVGAGLLYAATVWCGGYVVFLPGLLGLGLFALALCFRGRAAGARGLVRELLESAGMLVLLVGVLVAASAGRLLPSTLWTQVTDRVEGVDLFTSIADAFSIGEVGTQAIGNGLLTLILVASAVLFARDRRREALGILAAMVVLVLFTLGWPQRAFFHRFVPGFDRVRDPRHFWAPFVVLLPALAAFGVDGLLGGPARALAARLRGSAGVLAALGLVAALGLETRAWGVVRMQPILSLSERLEANALHQDLAARTASEPRFRVHDARDTRPKLKQTADLIRCALGVESLEGLIGNISIPDFDRDLIIPSRERGARLWGLLGCRYITCDRELELEGLELLQTFAEDPEELTPGTDGPYLYLNRRSVPRAAFASSAVLLYDVELNPRRRVLAANGWSPRREVLVRAAAADVEITPEVCASFATVVPGEAARGDQELAQMARDAGARIRRVPPLGSEADPAFALGTPDAPQLTPLADPERVWNGARVDVGGAPSDGWLVLAETYAIYPGWEARVDGEPARLWKANGAATAIPVPAGAREVVLRYTPPGWKAGMAVSLLALVAALGAWLFLERRARPA